MNGKPLKLMRPELLAFYGSRWFLLPAILFCAVLVILKPDDFESELPVWFRIIFWGVCLLTYLLLLNRAIRLVQNLGKWFNLGIRVPTVALHAILMPPVVIVATQAIAVFAQKPELMAELSALDVLRSLFLAIAFESLVVGFALPAWRRSQNDPLPAAPTVAVNDWVQIGEHRYELSKLVHAKSAEHYLEITTEAKTDLIRMRMRDFLALVPSDTGIQTHRSHWVSYGAVTEFTHRNGRKIVLLRDGTEIPVSRGRQRDVETRLAERERKAQSI